MAVSKSLVFGFLFLVALALTKAEPEPEANPSYGKPAAVKVIHYREEPVSRYVYTRHVHYHEPAPTRVVKYTTYTYPHVHEAYYNQHHEHLVEYRH